MVFSFSHFSLWKKYFRRFWSPWLYSWRADTLIWLQRSFWLLWPYGNFGHNSHFGHNGHITISAIMITIARYGCLQKRLDFRNTVLNFKTFWNIFFQRKKWEKLKTIFSPLSKLWLPLKKSWFSNEKGQTWYCSVYQKKIILCIYCP